jgi:Do/DeqQ family serine protease
MNQNIKIISISALSSILVFAILHFSFGNRDANTIKEDSYETTEMPIQTSFTSAQEMALPSFTEAADNSLHAVVHIITETTRKSSVYDDFFSLEDLFGAPRSRTYKATGSGVIISSDGYIITNNHVVENAEKVSITLNDKRTYDASIIGRDPSTDLALVKIEAEELPFLQFGNSDKVKIGDWVLAVGNPFNLTSTVTAGIVSAKARNINILGSNSAIESFIQTDAVVNRGNSGGALVDVYGKLIGINAAIASGTGYYTGYSFAIPASIAKKVVTDLKEYGTVQRAYIGVTIREVDDKLAKQIDLDDIQGVYIQGLVEDGAADEAGIEAGDVIIEVEGMAVNSRAELLEKTGQYHPGDKITVKAIRDNKIKNFTVQLTNKNGDTKLLEKVTTPLLSNLGAEFEIPSDKTLEKLGIESGVQISSLHQGALKNSGIKSGFIITKIDKKSVSTVEEIDQILKEKKGGILIEGIYPNGTRAYYGFGL